MVCQSYLIAVKNAAKKLVNVYESLEYLENLHVSSEDDLSNNADFTSSARLLILLPNDEGDRDND